MAHNIVIRTLDAKTFMLMVDDSMNVDFVQFHNGQCQTLCTFGQSLSLTGLIDAMRHYAGILHDKLPPTQVKTTLKFREERIETDERFCHIVFDPKNSGVTIVAVESIYSFESTSRCRFLSSNTRSNNTPPVIRVLDPNSETLERMW